MKLSGRYKNIAPSYLMRQSQLNLLVFAVALGLSGCATIVEPESQSVVTTSAASKASRCESDAVALDTDFVAGNIASCSVTGSNQINVSIEPEDDPPINCSAWYAFRLTPQKPGNVTVNLDYTHCGHRYWPKASEDGVKWTYLPKKSVVVDESGEIKSARINIKLQDKPVFVSAQEIVTPVTYQTWIDELVANGRTKKFTLGLSAEKRDIPGLNLGNVDAKEQVVLIGRQHPPEITGALALLPFVETLTEDTPLARKFRERFHVTVIPMLNPDGVVRGHWRHNTGSTDLNRDWGPFKQPETQLMDSLLSRIENDPGKRLSFFADFHSTQNDIFYTIPDEFPTKPALLIKNWLGLLQERMPDYKVKRSANSNLTQANSKNYVYKRYGVPTVTYEMGDETDRLLIRKIARQAAIAMMETLIASKVD